MSSYSHLLDIISNVDKSLINVADNAKLGTHIYTTTSRMEALKKYFDNNKKITIGKYNIDKKCIFFKDQLYYYLTGFLQEFIGDTHTVLFKVFI